MNKEDEERVRQIVKEEVSKWYVERVASPMLYGLSKIFTKSSDPDKAQDYESENTPHNQS
jgi:hypothetical protein